VGDLGDNPLRLSVPQRLCVEAGRTFQFNALGRWNAESLGNN